MLSTRPAPLKKETATLGSGVGSVSLEYMLCSEVITYVTRFVCVLLRKLMANEVESFMFCCYRFVLLGQRMAYRVALLCSSES